MAEEKNKINTENAKITKDAQADFNNEKLSEDELDAVSGGECDDHFAMPPVDCDGDDEVLI